MRTTLMLPVILLLLSFIAGCDSENPSPPAEEAPDAPGTPVTVTGISKGSLQDSISLNATATFLLKTPVKATTTGYITQVNAVVGGLIQKGQPLFVIRTKEAAALGNTINALDSSFHFSGLVNIHAPGSGYITTLNFQPGDYVQDGDVLATISGQNSFVFLLDLPYELRPVLDKNKTVTILLPDGLRIPGHVQSVMPAVDPAAQTQRVTIKTSYSRLIPEGLIVQIVLLRNAKDHITYVPEKAILTNEAQTEYWVMKLINDTTAVKVPVKTGITTRQQTEIVSPAFDSTDRIILTGQYGLPDTAKVSVTPQ